MEQFYDPALPGQFAGAWDVGFVPASFQSFREREEEIVGKIIGEGITFDDVLLVPAYSEVIPNQVDITTHLTQKIKL